MDLTPGSLLERGKYRIIDTLGQGGFGITYLAEQVMAKRKVCIKEFFPKDYYKRDEDTSALSLFSESNAEVMGKFKAKFIKEAQTIASLDHSNIIHIHDAFEENNTAYYVMEYIEGESLSALVKRCGALDEAIAVTYIRYIADALNYIHEQRVMHLDVNPGNIMVRTKDNNAILIDFGLSKHYDADSGEATSISPVGVSHGFAPMEQYKSGGVKEFSPATDIYSLGATLYYLVTGKVPPQAVCVADEGLPALPAHLSQDVRTAIERAMTFQRKHRPHSVTEFLALLSDVDPSPLSSETVGVVEVIPEVCEEATEIDIETALQQEQEVVEHDVDSPKPRRHSKRILLWLLLIVAVVGGITYYMYGKTKIYYTTSDGKMLQLGDEFDAWIVSHTYENGQGVIEFYGNVTTIGNKAFLSCDNLTSVTIPDSVTTIGNSAFAGCNSLTSVTIPNSVTTIGNSAFAGYNSLTSVTIPNSVTTIGNSAFSGCNSLTSVTIPNSVTTIGDGAFRGCRNLKEFKGMVAFSNGRCLIINGKLVAFAPAGITKFTIPDSVTTIGEDAFRDCNSLKSVTISDSVTTIGDSAFSGCSALKSVTIPDSVTTIGESAFYDCDSLTSVTIPNSVTTIEEWAFYSCSSLTSVTIPDSVTKIGNGAFSDCESLKSVTIQNGVTTIGEYTFYGCSALKSVTIPDSVTTIEEWAFYSCSSLTSVTIPDNVTTIGESAFYDCDSLTSVTIPDSVTEIGEYAFCDCSALERVTIPDSVTTIGEYAFFDCYNLSDDTKKKIRGINPNAKF